jgi:carboxylesterase type B
MANNATVNVAQGHLRGRKLTTLNGITYFSFQGIPYCKPPVGPLRFKVRAVQFYTPSISYWYTCNFLYESRDILLHAMITL